MKKHHADVELVVVGGGNAALCAAISAAERGVRTLILEAAPQSMRGGNSRHTRNFRCMHAQPLRTLEGSYGAAEFLDDLLQVTAHNTDVELAKQTIGQSAECYDWMQAHGVHFQPALQGTLSLSRTNAFFLGGGKALVNAYYRTFERIGGQVCYDAHVDHVAIENNKVVRVEYTQHGVSCVVHPDAVVVAAGGYQANIEWLARAWGPAARNFRVRGTPYNRGAVLADLQDQGVITAGDPTQCHAVAVDGRAPQFDGGIVTRLDCVPFSIVVNKRAERFYNEGEDLWPKRYAIWGRLIAAQPDQVGYALIDAKAVPHFMPSVFPPTTAASIADLARALGLPADRLGAVVADYNAGCGDGRRFSPRGLDGVATSGVVPPKTNWALPLDTPPYFAYELRTGVTFTYLGLQVDARARVATGLGRVDNLWAAGEMMAGSILGEGYLAGFGMTIGTVFGRTAGEEAAKYVRS